VTGASNSFHLTRRDLLGLAGKSAFLFGLGGVVYLLSRPVGFLRPPGAPEEGLFLSLCVKCQKCQEVCPTRAISQVLVTEDLTAVGTPRLNFRLGYCNLCLRCIEICPTGALQPVMKETVRLGVAQIDKERCVAWAWRGCAKCNKECPLGAIILDDDGRPIVDTDKCNGCGLCEYICPSPSLRAYAGGGGKGIVIVSKRRG